MDKLSKKSALKIVLQSKEIDRKKVEEFGGQVLSAEGEEIIFNYSNKVNLLIKELSKYKIEKLLINEQTLEDTFMDYYKSEER